MAVEHRRVRRRTVRGDIGGRRADDALHVADAARDERRVRERAEADRQVGARLGGVDGALAHHQVEVDLRIARQKAGQRGNEGVGAERDPDDDPQAPARLSAVAHRLVVGLLDGFDDSCGALEIGLAFGRRPQPAGGAVKQLDPEARLQLRDHLRQRRRGDAEVAGRAREASPVDGAEQDVHGEQGVQNVLSYSFRIGINRVPLYSIDWCDGSNHYENRRSPRCLDLMKAPQGQEGVP